MTRGVRYLVLAAVVGLLLALILTSILQEVALVDGAAAAVPTPTSACLGVEASPDASAECEAHATQLALQAVTTTPVLPPGCYYYDKANPLPDTCGLPPAT
jgi:hypothetical protein